MLYSTGEGTCVFLFDSEEAVFAAADEFYESEEEALETWGEWVAPGGWQVIDDPLPDCQHDCILPIRVKGRNEGAPQWGRYEILRDGGWYDLSMEQEP